MDESTAIAAEGHEASDAAAGADPCPRCGREVGDAWLVCAWCGEQIAAPAELPVGERLADGRYQVLGVIGRGGFGITYEVGDRRLQRRVAVKELFPESAVRHGSMVLTPPQARAGFRAARDRFLREARVLARFTHPGIVRVYEVFEEHGTAYLVMERLDGRTLVDLLRARDAPFTEEEVLDVAARVAAALRPVHAAGVLHRDVNPSNVMLTASGRVVVIDFGLARDYDDSHTVGMTRVVTPGYAPLEQYRGEARFGPSTDVYGLAATCYRLATGRVPVAAIERDAGAALPSPRAVNPEISREVSDALLDGLELEPSHRPQDLDSLLARLGVRRLPQGPRSLLVDAFPAADLHGPGPAPWPATAPPPVRESAPDAIEPVVDPVAAPSPPAAPAPEPVTDLTRIVPREPTSAPTAVEPDLTRTPDSLPTDATRVAGPMPDRPMPDRPMPDRPMVAAAQRPDAPVRAPLAVGPARKGRRFVTVPITVLALAVASAAPVLVTALVVLVAIPALATFGDTAAHRLRAQHGVEGGWAEQRMSPRALAPARFARNLAVGVVRCSPIVGMGAVLLGAWYAFDEAVEAPGVSAGALRLLGLLVVGLLLLSVREGSSRFRTGFGLDELVARWVPGGRVTQRLAVAWVVVAFLVAASFWLSPDPFPMP